MTPFLKRFLVVFVITFLALGSLFLWVFKSVFEAMPDMSGGVAEIVIEADSATCWSGQVGDATRNGCGSRTLQLASDIGIYVAVLQKSGQDNSKLTVTLNVKGETMDREYTTSPFGVVTVSGGNP
jgi:hypothetical protein